MRRLLGWMVLAAPVAVVFTLAELHAHLVGHYQFTGSTRLIWSIAYVMVLEVAAYAFGIPDGPESAMGALGTAVTAVVSAAVVISVFQLISGSLLLPRVVVFGAAFVLIPVYGLLTVGEQRSRARGDGAERVLAVLDPDEAALFEVDIDQAQERSAQLAGILAAGPEATSGVGSGELTARAGATGATVLVLGRRAQLDDSVVAQAAALHAGGVRVRTLTLFYDQWLGKLPVGDLERISLMFDIQEIHAPRYARLKRVVDLGAGVTGLMALALAIPLVALLDLGGNRGPLFFRQARVGKAGREFTIWKFRTMRDSAEVPGGSEWTSEDDPRLTPVGRWLRRVHLDELPQALNVLRGDLSLVGPRPEQPRYVAELTEKIPFYEIRHLVNPGVTGWAQVKFHYGASVDDALEKLQYEFFYLRHQGPMLDARIIARTLRQILRLRGR